MSKQAMPTKILFLNHTAFLGGAEVMLIRLIKYLNRNLIEPIAIIAEEGPLVEQLRSYGVRSYIVPIDPRTLALKRDKYEMRFTKIVHTLNIYRKYVYKIANFAKSKGIDKIFCNNVRAQIYGTLAGYFSNIPVIWRFHDILSEYDFIYPVRKLMSFLASRKIVVKILCVSQAVENSLRKEGIKGWKLQTIYNGIETFDKSTSKGKLRQQYGISTNTKLIGIIGRITLWKGQEIVIKAVSKVLKNGLDIVLLVVGSPFSEEERKYEKNLRKLAKDLGLRRQIIFTGFRKDIPSVLKELDLVVHASLNPDPFPTVILEAMAAGRPVIASNCGGVPEMVQHEETGLLFPSGDSDRLAECIRYALSNEEKMRMWGQNARKQAFDKFSIEKYIKNTETILTQNFRS
ncbi:MAG: hypothetical protein DRP55_08140 [Spirochaetes bacterium]|nr:MAG: hypothetical protein DRP55_08140 [Spirochaetota bacterium]